MTRVIDKINSFETQSEELASELWVLESCAHLLPPFLVECDKLKEVSFKENTLEEKQKNAKIMRCFLSSCQSLESNVLNCGTELKLSRAILDIIADKRVSYESIVDVFYRK